jgi:hypothetical protein
MNIRRHLSILVALELHFLLSGTSKLVTQSLESVGFGAFLFTT